MKKRIYTPGTLNPRMPTLVISLSALVMLTFAVFAPATVAAADIAFVAGNPKTVDTHCSDTLAEPNSFWKGVYFDCSTGSADASVSADLGMIELRRTYGSSSFDPSTTANPSADVDEGYVGEWRGTVTTAQPGVNAAGSEPFVQSATNNPSADVDEGYVGEWRGTIITAQPGAKTAAEVTANSGPLWMGRTYGYD